MGTCCRLNRLFIDDFVLHLRDLSGFMPGFELQLVTNLLLLIYLPIVCSKLCSFVYFCIFCRHIFVVQSNQAGYALLGT